MNKQPVYTEKEYSSFLRGELREYEAGYTCMTVHERAELREWVSGGNSPYDNPYFLYGDDGKIMDFIKADRTDKEIAESRGGTGAVVNPGVASKYKQLKVSVDPAVASDFKRACANSGVSMASKLTELMSGFSKTASKRKPVPDYSTRRKRRAAVVVIIKQLELIRDAEQDYQDRIPENLQGSIVFERADELVSMLDEAIDLMAQM